MTARKSKAAALPRGDKPAKPDPSPLTRDAINAATDFLEAAATPATVTLTKDNQGVLGLGVPHNDHAGGMARLRAALGTRSVPFLGQSLDALATAARARGAPLNDDASGLNGALALVQAIAPQNELEAALAVQMSSVHNLAADMLGKAKQTDSTDHLALYGGLAVKLARTFTLQAESLAKLRGGGKQTVEVKHVYVNGNAVVGDVHAGAPAGGGVAPENAGQPHAQALAHDPGESIATMWSADSERDAMSVASGAVAEALPDARRR